MLLVSLGFSGERGESNPRLLSHSQGRNQFFQGLAREFPSQHSRFRSHCLGIAWERFTEALLPTPGGA